MKTVVMVKHGGIKRDYFCAYVDGVLDWSGLVSDPTFPDYLIALTQRVATSSLPVSVQVESVHDMIAKSMGLTIPFPATLAEYRAPRRWLKLP